MTTYNVQFRESRKAPWRKPKFGRTYDLVADAIAFARDCDEMGGCGPVRVVDNDGSVVWTPAADREAITNHAL